MTKEKMKELARAYINAETVFVDHAKARGILEAVRILIGEEEYQNEFLPLMREVHKEEYKN
jgi:hypothetical protein